MTSDLITRTFLDQYRVDAFVAAGGMGVVYRVWDLNRSVNLALKVLHEDLADDPAILKRFRREARALERLAHPNIVTFYGLHQTEEFTFLLQRFVAGPTLKEILRQQEGAPFPVAETLCYLKVLSAALGYAHTQGVVHSDIKPGNVLVDPGGAIYLTDFGIARHAESTATTLGIAGSPAYMAPEQVRGEPVSSATDVYALGVMLFEMLTGQRPFRGDEAGTESAGPTTGERLRYAHQYIPPPDLRSLNPALPPALTGVVSKALAKDPGDRYQDIQEFYFEVCAGLGVRPDEVRERATLSTEILVSLEVKETVAPVQPAQGRGKVPGIWVVLIGSMVVIAVLAFFIGTRLGLPATVAQQVGEGQPLPGDSEILTVESPATITGSSPGQAVGGAEATRVVDMASTQAFLTVEANLTPVDLNSPALTPPNSTENPLPTAISQPANLNDWQRGRLTFVARHGNSTALFVLDLTNKQDPELLYKPDNNGLLLGPVWSADSNQIAFYTLGPTLYVIQAEPGEQPRVVRDCSQPYWKQPPFIPVAQLQAPEEPADNSDTVAVADYLEALRNYQSQIERARSEQNDELICRANRAGNTYFEVVNALSGSLVESYPVESGAQIPAWTPQDDLIVYAAFEGERTAIWKLSGDLPVLLTDPAVTENYAPVWSPDGQWIAYQSTMDSNLSEIWVMDQEGNNSRRLTYSPINSWSRGPAWSPDGQWIAFVSNREQSFGPDYGEIYVVSVLTGETYRVTNTGGLIYDWRVSWGWGPG
jgi:hypothetical protein